jgi:rare lipoprotein A
MFENRHAWQSILLGAISLGLFILLASTMRVYAAESCRASWYGFESGARMANGQKFRPMGLTAAHRTIPFGAHVRVFHAGKSVVVRITDRGPFVKGRCLDVSRGAARALGIEHAGVALVRLERLN